MEQDYTVRNLQLFESIECDGVEKNGRLYNCTTAVTEKTLEPKAEDYIIVNSADENKVIPAGKYLFLQGILSENCDLVENEQEKNFPITHEVREAAMELYLQILWNEKKTADNIIYLRVLHEEHGYVFQLIRKILAGE